MTGGILLDHSSINRRAVGFVRLLEKIFRKHKGQVFKGGRID
jgi:hypothetical protein